MRSRVLRCVVLWALPAFVRAALAADDPCAGFRWDVRPEHALFATAAEAVLAGQAADSAPKLVLDKLYELTLAPRERITFAASSGSKTPATSTFAGLARLRVTAAGDYRVSVDPGVWVDIAANHQLIAPDDFQGQPDCHAPRKIVVYRVSGGQDLIVQLSGSSSSVRLTITRVRGQ